MESKDGYTNDIDMMDEIKNCNDPDIMYGRFYENKTLSEIAKENSITKEAVRLRIKNLKIIKSDCLVYNNKETGITFYRIHRKIKFNSKEFRYGITFKVRLCFFGWHKRHNFCAGI